jgi:putative transcriptional regulator
MSPIGPRQHPSDATLARYAAGRLGAGLRLVVDTHLESCPRCREAARMFCEVGGALLETLPPAPVSRASLDRIFARIEAAPAEPPRPAEAPIEVDGFALPAAMSGCKVGPWRFVHPKLRWARVTLPEAPRDRLVLLKIAPGFSAPAHDHRGLELTQIFYGAFSDGRELYGPGDLVEADEAVTRHEPRVTAEGECLCLAAVEQPLRVRSLLGRLFQPLMGL